MTAIEDLVQNPTYLAYKFNFDNECVEFLPLIEGDLQRATWLKQSELGSDRRLIAVPLAQLAKTIKSQKSLKSEKPTRFIFHTAYCASTFLTRCLDASGMSVSLREPQLLLDAANAKRLKWRSKSNQFDYRHLITFALALFKKHASVDESLIIKPINSVNNIIPELLQVIGPSKSLMLYTDARNFLLSTLKKGEEARQTVRAMFDLTRCDFPHLSHLRLTDAIHMSDLKITLTLWRLQLEQAEQVLAHFSTNEIMASLYAEVLVENPLNALHSVNRFLDLGIPAEKITEIGNGDTFAKDAKNTKIEFSASRRQEKYRAVKEFYGTDLDNAYHWLISNNPATQLKPELSSPLKV